MPAQNLYIPGLQADGTPVTLVDIPGYWSRTRAEQARGGRGELYLEEAARAAREATNAPVVSLLTIDRIDARTGRVASRLVTHNVETDTLINRMLATYYGTTGDASAATHFQATTGTYLGQYLAIDTATAASQASSTIASGTASVTAIPVLAGGAAAAVASNAATSFIAAASNNGTAQNTSAPGTKPDAVYGTGIAWSYGTANVEYVAGTTTASTATSINIASYTTTKAHATNDWVVASPSVADNPSAGPAGVQYSPAITATYTTTSGIGNRKAQLQYTFPTTTPAAGYTGIWVVTATTWAAGIAYGHISTNPQNINASTSLQVTYQAIF